MEIHRHSVQSDKNTLLPSKPNDLSENQAS